MKTKIIIILVCMLVFATVATVAGSMNSYFSSEQGCPWSSPRCTTCYTDDACGHPIADYPDVCEEQSYISRDHPTVCIQECVNKPTPCPSPVYHELIIHTEGSGFVLRPLGPYVHGREITISACTFEGWQFSHWNGDLTGSDNPATFVMDSDKEITAVFVQSDYFELKIWCVGSGSLVVSPQGRYFPAGTEVTIEAIPYWDYEFSHWEIDATGDDNPLTITMDSDKTIVGVFLPVRYYHLSVHTVGEGMLLISSPGPGHTYPAGSEIFIDALPSDGWRFSHWEGDLTGSEDPVTIIMDSDKDITAVFVEKPNNQPLYGDANDDGMITPGDAQRVLDFISDPSQEQKINFENADVDDNGILNRVDANIIFYDIYLKGLTQDELPLHVVLGDANGSDRVTIADVVLEINFILDPANYSEHINIRNGDVDGDNEITYDDVELLTDFLLGKISRFPIEDPQYPPL